jgi:DedD protein
MARPISDEELQLKRRARRRLIGAIVLVTAIVVALPMVLDTDPRPITGEISIKIPSPNSNAFTARVEPVPPSAEPRPEAKPPTPPATPRLATAMGEQPDAAAGTASFTEPKAPAPEKAATPVPAEAAAPAKDALPAQAETEPAGQAFAVQVAALADADKVRQVQSQIAAGGLKSYTEVVKTAKGDVTRVRVGPYPTRPAAEKARDQLKALGLSGNIVAK